MVSITIDSQQVVDRWILLLLFVLVSPRLLRNSDRSEHSAFVAALPMPWRVRCSFLE